MRERKAGRERDRCVEVHLRREIVVTTCDAKGPANFYCLLGESPTGGTMN